MSKRILLVDDSAFICAAVGSALRAAGFDLDLATDLFAFEADDAPKPDLVLMDVVLQEAYGDEIAELLRATRGFSCPIVLFSALPEVELAQRSREAGLDGYIVKKGGLAAIVARANELLGTNSAATNADLKPSFDVSARQRMRRVVHVFAQANQWSATAIAGEMQALAGDSDLVGATAIAKAARACREAVIQQGSGGWTPEIGAALNALSTLLEDKQPRGGTLLVIEDRALAEALVPSFDAAGHVVFEARSLAEARQKLRATDFDAIVLDTAIERDTGTTLIEEIRGRIPTAKLVVLGKDLPRDTPPAKLAEHVNAVVARRRTPSTT